MASDEELEKQLKRLNKDNDKPITIVELRKYYLLTQEKLGIAPQLAEQEIQGLIKRLDIDANGKISFEGKNKNSFHIFHQP